MKFFFELETCCLNSHDVSFEDYPRGELSIELMIQVRIKFASELLHGTISHNQLFAQEEVKISCEKIKKKNVK